MLPRSPLPRVCVALGFPNANQILESARHEIAEGETFFEFRLDYLADPMSGVAAIQTLLRQAPDIVVLATCRRSANHGHFEGSVESQLAILAAAVEAGATGVDLEIESAELVPSTIDELKSRTLVVTSWHNFESTPSMLPVLRRMARVPSDVWKIVTTARKPSDILRVLDCARTQKQKVVLLTMGETGMPGRILAPIHGSLWTYVAPASSPGTAPGQIHSRQMRNLYKLDKLTRSAKVYGVIADPVGHSLSPAIHNRALQSRRIDAVYLPFLVQPAYLRDFVTLASKLPLSGFSVTIPHKQKIVRYLDHIDPVARRIGAVNTVWRKAGKWRGTNTDVAGVLEPLRRRIRLPKASILIAGNGGAARGAAFALSDAGAQVSIVGRTAKAVRALAKCTGATPYTPDSLNGHHFDAVVHATPLGMFPYADGCFFADKIPADLVFDMVYNPLETELIRRAREQGLETIAGIEMFVEQAAHQFELWTGESAPKSLMEKTVSEALGGAQ
ncbi:MAG: shikimate dehydrogenase [Bryobacteraceae bacterium]|nr:shikimate dehydrogenase [Bryobacteraceae bacterium]